MISRVLKISIGLSTSLFAIGYAFKNLWFGVIVITILGSLWLFGVGLGWKRLASLMLFFCVCAGAIGLGLGLASPWMLLGVVAGLSAWDLDHFSQRVKRVDQVEGKHELERRHLRRLLIVDGTGLGLAVVASNAKIKFSFGLVFLLGLLAVFGLSRVISFLRRESS